MIKYIKIKVNSYINKLIDSKIENYIGKEHKESKSFSSIFDRVFYGVWSDSFPEEKDGSTGLFKRIEKLEEKVYALEKLLKVKYVNEEKKFSGYKKTNKK